MESLSLRAKRCGAKQSTKIKEIIFPVVTGL